MKKYTFRSFVEAFRIPILGALVFALVAIAGIQMAAASTDSGLQACKDIVARSEGKTPAPTTRAAFEKSNYADLIAAGTNFVDAVQEGKTRVNDDSGLQTDFGVLTKVHATYASLQIACGAHGVKLPNLKS